MVTYSQAKLTKTFSEETDIELSGQRFKINCLKYTYSLFVQETIYK